MNKFKLASYAWSELEWTNKILYSLGNERIPKGNSLPGNTPCGRILSLEIKFNTDPAWDSRYSFK